MTNVDPAAVELAHRLFDAARSGDSAAVAAHVDAGVPVNILDPQGNSMVMLAAYSGHAATVQALVDRGADVDLLNARGQSPLAGAIFKGESEVVAVLLAAGADPEAGTPTARAAAEMFGSSELLRHSPEPT